MEDRIGFVILHYGDVRVTDRCIQSICRLSGSEDTLIVVVDNEVSRNRAEREENRKHFETAGNIHVLLSFGKGGFSEANNLGYAYAREQGCRFILVLNNDIEFDRKDFLVRLKEIWREKACHVLAPDVVRAGTGEHQNPLDTRIRTAKEAERTIRLNRAALAVFPLVYPVLDRWEQREEKRQTLQRLQTGSDSASASDLEDIVPFGACLIFTPAFVTAEKKAFEPETRFFYEEYILALRCRKKGYLIRYVPELHVLHESGAATGHTYHTSAAKLRFRLERTGEAAEVYLRYLQSGE